MTTTQHPLKPGDRVLVEAEVLAATRGLRVRTIPAGPSYDGKCSSSVAYFDLPQVVWHPMPVDDGEDGTAEYVADLEAELAAAKGAFEAEHKAYLFVEAVTVRLGQEIGRLEAERDALRKVYDAAEAWRVEQMNTRDRMVANNELRNAVDAYRAAQKALADAPAARRSDEPAEAGATDTPEPQTGAEAVEPDRCWSCDHEIGMHFDPEGCQYTVGRGSPGHNSVCACSVTPEPLPEWERELLEEQAADAPRLNELAERYGASPFTPTRSDLTNAHTVAKVDAQPQPTDAPGRRDWAAEIVAVLDRITGYGVIRRGAVAQEIVVALDLPGLEDERDDLRERAEHYQRERDEARAEARFFAVHSETNVAHALGYDPEERYPGWRDLLTQVASEHRELLDLRTRVDVADELDALRAGVKHLSKRRDLYAAPHWQAAARALLDAPPTSTPDGTNGAPDLMAALDGSEDGTK